MPGKRAQAPDEDLVPVRERIRQIEALAMSTLRHPTAGGDLHELLPDDGS